MTLQLTQAKTYRWTDKNGKVHYSQSVPPSASQLGHQELDEKSGFTINEVESSEVRVRRKKEQQLKDEKDRLNKQALREELMIYMFSSKKEMIQHFEYRLNTISVNIRLLEYHKKKLKNTISKLGAEASSAKNKALKEKLELKLQEYQRSLIDHSRAIGTNEKERKEVSDQMSRAIKLYDKKYGGGGQLNVGSLIGSNVLDELRSNSNKRTPVKSSKEQCSCPCSAAKPAPRRLFE